MAWNGSHLRVASDETDARILACEIARATGKTAFAIEHRRDDGSGLWVASSEPDGSGLPVGRIIDCDVWTVPPERPAGPIARVLP